MNAPWFVHNERIHEDLGVNLILSFVEKSTEKFLDILYLDPGASAVMFNIEQVTLN